MDELQMNIRNYLGSGHLLGVIPYSCFVLYCNGRELQCVCYKVKRSTSSATPIFLYLYKGAREGEAMEDRIPPFGPFTSVQRGHTLSTVVCYGVALWHAHAGHPVTLLMTTKG